MYFIMLFPASRYRSHVHRSPDHATKNLGQTIVWCHVCLIMYSSVDKKPRWVGFYVPWLSSTFMADSPCGHMRSQQACQFRHQVVAVIHICACSRMVVRFLAQEKHPYGPTQTTSVSNALRWAPGEVVHLNALTYIYSSDH